MTTKDDTEPHRRAMADIDAVAEAICDAQYDGHPTWQMISEEARNATYRPMALAAINAIGLTEEWRTTGFLGPVSESFARSQARVKGELQRRLVTEWKPADQQTE